MLFFSSLFISWDDGGGGSDEIIWTQTEQEGKKFKMQSITIHNNGERVIVYITVEESK